MVRSRAGLPGNRGMVLAAVISVALPLAVPARASGFRSAAAAPLAPGDRVVCLFDSSEGSTARRNPLSGAVAEALRHQGFQVEWRDAAGGPPSRTDVAGARAVITGFRDGRIAHARALIEFLREPGWMWLGLTANQWLSIAIMVAAFIAFQFRRRRAF